MSKYIISIKETPEPLSMYVDANGWLQPDKGLALRYDTSAAAQAEIDSHYTAYGTTGTVLTVSS